MNEMTLIILDKIHKESNMIKALNPELACKVLLVREIFQCLVEEDENFRSRIEEVANEHLDEIVEDLTKIGYVF